VNLHRRQGDDDTQSGLGYNEVVSAGMKEGLHFCKHMISLVHPEKFDPTTHLFIDVDILLNGHRNPVQRAGKLPGCERCISSPRGL